MEVKVLGTGCASCRNTISAIEKVALAKGAQVNIQKVEDLRDIMAYGVMSTPGVVIDGKVVHSGGVPPREKIEQWFADPAPLPAPAEAGGCCGGGPSSKCCG